MAITEQSLRKIYKIALTIAGIGVIYYFALSFFNLIIMLAVALLISMIFDPIVNWLEQQGVNRLLASLVVLIGALVILLTGFSVLIPKIVNQMNRIGSSFTEENVNMIIQEVEAAINVYFPFIDSSNLAEKIGNFISSAVFDSIDNISNIVTSIFSVIAIVIIVPFMTFFLLKDKAKIIKGIINIMPNRYFEMSYAVINRISHDLGRFVSGWILDAFFVGVMAAIGLAILGIDNSISIGLIAGIGHLIPYFGPIIGGLPAVLISIIQFGDLSMLPSIIIMFIIIYSFDNGYVQPNVFSKSTDMHPLLIIVLILLGSQIMGVFGMLLAVPIATVVKTAAREIYHGYRNYKIIKV